MNLKKTFRILANEFKWDLDIEIKLTKVKGILEEKFEEYLEDKKMPKNLDNIKQEKFDYISKKLINLKQHSIMFPFV